MKSYVGIIEYKAIVVHVGNEVMKYVYIVSMVWGSGVFVSVCVSDFAKYRSEVCFSRHHSVWKPARVRPVSVVSPLGGKIAPT